MLPARNKVFLSFTEVIYYWANDEKIRSFFLLFQFLGIFPFVVHGGKFEIKIKLYLWNISILFAFIALCLSFILYIPPFLTGSTLVLFNGGQMVLLMLPIFLLPISLNIKKYKLDKYLHFIRSTQYSSFGHSNTITFIILTFCQTAFTLFILTNFQEFIKNINMYAIYYTSFVLCVSIVGQFSGILNSIKYKFICLTKSLDDNASFVDALKTYEQLITICEEVNDIYAHPVIFLFLYCFVLLIILYCTLLSKESFIRVLVYIVYSVIGWLTQFRLTFTCSQVMYQVSFQFYVFFSIGLHLL